MAFTISEINGNTLFSCRSGAGFGQHTCQWTVILNFAGGTPPYTVTLTKGLLSGGNWGNTINTVNVPGTQTGIVVTLTVISMQGTSQYGRFEGTIKFKAVDSTGDGSNELEIKFLMCAFSNRNCPP